MEGLPWPPRTAESGNDGFKSGSREAEPEIGHLTFIEGVPFRENQQGMEGGDAGGEGRGRAQMWLRVGLPHKIEDIQLHSNFG